MKLNESLLSDKSNSSFEKSIEEDKVKTEVDLLKEEKIKSYLTDGDIYTQSSCFSKLIFWWAFRIIKVRDKSNLIY